MGTARNGGTFGVALLKDLTRFLKIFYNESIKYDFFCLHRMSHVSALPGPGGGISSGLDQTAEAAQYALTALSDLNTGDAIDATVCVVGAAAVLRVLYGVLGSPSMWNPLKWLVALARTRRAKIVCD